MSEPITVKPPVFTENIAEADDFTKKHTPYIEIEMIEGAAHVTVKLGYYVAHPNEEGHFFDRIDILANETPLVHFAGIGGAVDPEVSTVLHLEPGTEITALAHCNLHGSFGATATL